jgi:aspartate racemase
MTKDVLNINPSIGLLGLADRSTRYYLQKLNAQYNHLYGGYSTCPIKLLNVDFERINPFLPDDFKQLIPVTRQSLLELLAMHVDQIVIPNITLHSTLEQFQLETELYEKIAHPLTLLSDVINFKNRDEVRLLGTRHKNHGDYVSRYLERLQVSVTFPSQDNLQENEALRRDVYSDNEQKDQLTEFYTQINQYINEGDGLVVIACTELSIAWDKAQQMNDTLFDKSRVIDLSQLQIDAAIERLNAINKSLA